MSRRVSKDEQSGQIESIVTVKVEREAEVDWITGWSSMRLCGWQTIHRTGSIFLRHSVSGRPSLPALAGGLTCGARAGFSHARPVRRTWHLSGSIQDVEGPFDPRGAKGAQAAANDSSCDEPMNRVCAAVDAVGPLLLIHPTRAQCGDGSPVETLPSAMKGIGHAIADAAHDANPLRSFLTDSLSATAQVNPTGRLRR